MSSVRAIVTIAVPAVTALLGLLWYFGRRKQPAQRRLVDPPDKRKKSTGTPEEASETSLEAKGSASVSKLEVSNGQAGKSSSTIPETPASSTSSEKTHFECLPTDRGENISLSTAALSTDTNLTGVGDAGREIIEGPKVTAVEDVIQESVIKPSFTQQCTSDRTLEADSGKFVEDSLTSESAEACLHAIEESVISQTKVENVFTAPEFSSPAFEQTITAEKSQDANENISTDAESLSLSNKATDNHVSLKSKTPDHDSEKSSLSSNHDNVLSNEFESQEVQQVDSFTRSWHEDIPETDNLADLTENISNVSNDSPQKFSENVQRNSDNSTISADEAEKKAKTEKLESDNCSSQSLSPLKNSRTNREMEKLQSSPSSQSGLQNEKNSENNNHSDSSSNCDNLSEASNDSGKGGSVQENTSTSPADEDRLFEFNIPSDLCGLFIGTRGKTIKMISQQSGTKIRLQNNPYTRDFQICVVEGSQSAIDTACNIVKRKFPAIKFPGMDLTPAANPVIMPEIMQLSLPEGVSVDVVVSSIVDAGRLFVQQPTHPTYPSLDRLNTFMNQCYMQEGAVPDIPKPIESGVICAAPMLNGWYRAQIMATHDGCDECDIKYVDYGGYSRVSSSLLKQIRSDFMTLPFEAVECYLANITPLEDEQYFSTEAAVVLEELTQGKLLQGQVVGRAEDGIPYVHVYQILAANSVLLVNREMVNRGVVRWIELME